MDTAMVKQKRNSTPPMLYRGITRKTDPLGRLVPHKSFANYADWQVGDMIGFHYEVGIGWYAEKVQDEEVVPVCATKLGSMNRFVIPNEIRCTDWGFPIDVRFEVIMKPLGNKLLLSPKSNLCCGCGNVIEHDELFIELSEKKSMCLTCASKVSEKYKNHDAPDSKRLCG